MTAVMRVVPAGLLLLLSAAAGQQAAPARRQLRWYLGDAPRVDSILLHDNPNGWLGTNVSLAAPITGGIYQCCHGNAITTNGTLSYSPTMNASAYYGNLSRAGIDTFYTVTHSCGQDLGKCACPAFARADAFAQELLQWVERWNLTGVHTDWEAGPDNDLRCWVVRRSLIQSPFPLPLANRMSGWCRGCGRRCTMCSSRGANRSRCPWTTPRPGRRAPTTSPGPTSPTGTCAAPHH